MPEFFNGFNADTVRYFEAIMAENTKDCHLRNKLLYESGVRDPLAGLYWGMQDFLRRLDQDLLSPVASSVSSPYADARFSRGEPMKQYFYLRFRCCVPGLACRPGFFLDASLSGYRYGLALYGMDARAHRRLEYWFSSNRGRAADAVGHAMDFPMMSMPGLCYKEDRRHGIPGDAGEFLMRKSPMLCVKRAIDAMFVSGGLQGELEQAFEALFGAYVLTKEAFLPEA